MPVPVSLEPSARKTKMPGGLREVGNLDPQKPMAFVKNSDGSTSTVRTIGIGTDRGETVIPTVARDGRIMSNPEAVKQYQSSGENFGTFVDQKSAAAYADELHNKQAELVPENTRGGNMADYWGANWRNFQRGVGLNSTPQEEVTGDLAGGLRDLTTPPAATAPNVYGITTKPLVAGAPTDTARFPKGAALPGMLNGPWAPAGPEPAPAAAPSTTQSQGVSIPVGKYGWKGSLNAEGNPSLAFGTPGTEGSGVGSWRPGSATPATPQDSSVIDMPPAQGLSRMEPTGRMIQARSTGDFLPQQTAPAAAPIDFASMDRAGRRFALKNAILSNEQQQTDNAVGIASMQEQGAGARAMLVAKNQQDANNLGLRRLVGDEAAQEMDMEAKQLGIDATRRTEAVRQAYIDEKDPVKKRELGKQWSTLQGKDVNKFQIVSKKGVGPDGFTPTETSYAVNPDNPAESYEVGAKASSDPAMAIVGSNPAYQKAYAAATPEKQKQMLDAVRARMATPPKVN